MGSAHISDLPAGYFISPIKELLKQRDIKVSNVTIIKIVKDLDAAAPWFVVSGDLSLPTWEKLGRDLEMAKQEGQLGKGTLPFWRLIHSCLSKGSHVDLLKEGRKALARHQDSLSESDRSGEVQVRPKRKQKKKV